VLKILKLVKLTLIFLTHKPPTGH